MDPAGARVQNPPMRKRTVGLCLALLGGGLAQVASAGTKLVRTSREPSAGPLNFSKVLVLVVAPHASQMQFGEAVLVQMMKRTRGVSAHAVMSEADAQDEQKMRAFMAREGFDGAVTMRFVGSGQEVTEEAGIYVTAYPVFWDHYSTAWTMVFDPGYVRTERWIQMETLVYSMKDGKLVWSGLTQTKNPKDAKDLVESVARAAAKDLKKQGLIQ
jgi:hypothetical protein